MKDVTIWRYMDFTKFVDLVSTQEMFFCRSDLLGDPFEGSYPVKHHERRFEEIQRTAKDFQKEIMMFHLAAVEYTKYVHLNCWHMSDCESAALWRLYLKSDEGIALRSSRDRLGSAFADSEPGVWSMPVEYIDYIKDDPPVPTRIAPFRYKRKSFEHERELRAFVYLDFSMENGRPTPAPAPRGIRLKVDLARLIDTVFVAPTAPDWFLTLTARVAKHFGVRADVVRSSLATEQPIFI